MVEYLLRVIPRCELLDDESFSATLPGCECRDGNATEVFAEDPAVGDLLDDGLQLDRPAP